MFKNKPVRDFFPIFLIWVSILFASCSSWVNAKGDMTNSSGTPVVEVKQVPPEATPTPVECSANPSAVNIQVEPQAPTKHT